MILELITVSAIDWDFVGRKGEYILTIRVNCYYFGLFLLVGFWIVCWGN
jgi:hypothetical protein